MLRSWLLMLCVVVPATATAVVIRHDVDDAKYRIEAGEFPALVDMPGEGHGVLIDRQWVVTAAHTLPRHAPLDQVQIDGKPRDVERVVVHPGYRTPPEALVEQAMATGEAVLILALIAATDDIALVQLKEPVTDVAAVARYPHDTEYGKVIRIVGKGATGTGMQGHDPKGPNRTTLRRAFNTVTSAHERWFCYVFDEPPQGLPLEGIGGNGDSGSPALIEVDGEWTLAGLAAWKFLPGDVRTARPGRYGQVSCNVRLAHYRDWIDGVMSGTQGRDGQARSR